MHAGILYLKCSNGSPHFPFHRPIFRSTYFSVSTETNRDSEFSSRSEPLLHPSQFLQVVNSLSLEVAGSPGSDYPVKLEERQKGHRISWTSMSRLKQQTNETICRFCRGHEWLPIWGREQNFSAIWEPDFDPSYSARSLPSADRNSNTELHYKKIKANIFIESKNSLKEILLLIPIKLESVTWDTIT
jgi:hypothetical protein